MKTTLTDQYSAGHVWIWLFSSPWVSACPQHQCFPLNNHPTFLTCLKNRKAANKRHRSMKRKDFGRESSLSRSAFQRPWLCGRENKTNLYVGFELSTWIAGVPCHPKQWKTASVMNIQTPQKKSVVWKGKHEGERLLSREQLPTGTALQLKQSHLGSGNWVITFSCFAVFLKLILFPYLGGGV